MQFAWRGLGHGRWTHIQCCFMLPKSLTKFVYAECVYGRVYKSLAHHALPQGMPRVQLPQALLRRQLHLHFFCRCLRISLDCHKPRAIKNSEPQRARVQTNCPSKPSLKNKIINRLQVGYTHSKARKHCGICGMWTKWKHPSCLINIRIVSAPGPFLGEIQELLWLREVCSKNNQKFKQHHVSYFI